MSPPYADYHTHTSRCGHAVGSPVEYVEAARVCGLVGVGISDHMPLVGHPDPDVSMRPGDLADYVAEVQQLKRRHPGYVLLGIEADYMPGRVNEIRGVLDSYPFDYVIGSVHYLDDWGFDNPEQIDGFDERDINDVYLRYLELLGDAAETGLYTIIGHLDLVKKFGHRPTRGLEPAFDRLLERLRGSAVVMEVNTAGLRNAIGEMYPEASILRRAESMGIPITFGSDAHTPSHVGWGFVEAAAAVRAAGHRTWVRLRESPGCRAERVIERL